MRRMLRNEGHRRRADTERISPPATTAAGDGGPAPGATGDVQVISGAGVQSFPLAGLQISHARTLLAPILQLDPRAVVLVNGERVRASHRLTASDTVEFVHHAGEKGA
ncbi:MAG: hypothetical protein HY510_03005 [Acidobacteria bacterium]|nr:hypothetical protein [Acidobacteriota bacterium]